MAAAKCQQADADAMQYAQPQCCKLPMVTFDEMTVECSVRKIKLSRHGDLYCVLCPEHTAMDAMTDRCQI